MTKNKGWVRLWREQFSHWVSERKPWCDGYAWSYLYAQANHKRGVVNFRNQYIQVERGQFVTSMLKLSSVFGWNRRRTSNLLLMLETQGMCDIRRTNRFIVITICNYEKYQSPQGENDTTDETTGDTTDAQQMHTNKNVKNKELKIYCNSFETISSFLSSLSDFQIFSLEARELIIEFVNHVRSANATKAISQGKITEIVSRFRNIQNETDAECLLAGLKAVFKKIKGDGFDFKKRDPTAYVMSVAKSRRAGKMDEDHSARVEEERRATRRAKSGTDFNNFCESIVGEDE
jgi:hypothetical protein